MPVAAPAQTELAKLPRRLRLSLPCRACGSECATGQPYCSPCLRAIDEGTAFRSRDPWIDKILAEIERTSFAA